MINTILVIDDNVFDNAIIKNYLYGERYSIVSALNGREALELIESRNIDLILLDIVMPIMDGYDFLKEFSKNILLQGNSRNCYIKSRQHRKYRKNSRVRNI